MTKKEMPRPFPNGVFVGIYKGVSYYAAGAKIQCLFGWMPKEFQSIRACKCAITKWHKDESEVENV